MSCQLSADDVHVHVTIRPGSSIASFIFYAKIPAVPSSRKTLLHLNDHTTCDFSHALITNITAAGNALEDTPAARIFKAPLLIANDPESSPLVRRASFSPLVEKRTSVQTPDLEKVVEKPDGSSSSSLSERSFNRMSPVLRQSSRSLSPTDRFRKDIKSPAAETASSKFGGTSTGAQSPLSFKPRPRAPSAPPVKRGSILKNSQGLTRSQSVNGHDRKHSDPFMVKETPPEIFESSPMTDRERMSGFFTVSPHFFQRVENDVQLVFSDDSVAGTTCLVQIPFDMPVDNWETEGWKTLCLANIFSELNNINLKVSIDDEESGDWIFKASAQISELDVSERTFSALVSLPQISDFILDWKRRDEIELLHCDEGVDVKSSIELENNTAKISNQVYFLGRGETIICDTERLTVRLVVKCTEQVEFTFVGGEGIVSWTALPLGSEVESRAIDDRECISEPGKSLRPLDKETNNLLDADNSMQTIVPESNICTLEIERSNESIWEPIYVKLQVPFTNTLVVPSIILSTSGTVYSSVDISTPPYHVKLLPTDKWRQIEPSNHQEMTFKNVCQNTASSLQNLTLSTEKIEFVGKKISENVTSLIRYTIDKCPANLAKKNNDDEVFVVINAYLDLACLLDDSPILRFALPPFSEILWVSIDGKNRDNIVYRESSGIYAISDQEIFIQDNQVDVEIICLARKNEKKVELPVIMDKTILKLLVNCELPTGTLSGTSICLNEPVSSLPTQFHVVPPGEKLFIKFTEQRVSYKRVISMIFIIWITAAFAIFVIPFANSTWHDLKIANEVIQDLAFDIALLNYQTMQLGKSIDNIVYRKPVEGDPEESNTATQARSEEKVVVAVVSPGVKEILQEPKRLQRQMERINKWNVPEDEKERFRAALTWWK
ncbi:hypothetical protein NEOLI_004284 [Neolecta irregularis DAH-3]|uniref:Transmembrane protein n=1 Tax=Neolecta irregularis (strain DAH-3) TaxID=1198029 RepID=A0A1U7LVE6_NEOID|nr:hypothetical protein NEOLI_004284 [Neolecta irregularis DAH-3]|eukprot:OLL26599.1 hypothetical protein NEOLI_004284 [Neolecta irregularis DAH-3]